MKSINLEKLAKRVGLYKFSCPKCGKEQKGMPALRALFNLILAEAGKGKKVIILGFGNFLLTSWEAPDSKITRNCDRIYRLSFKASSKAKKKIMEMVKEE